MYEIWLMLNIVYEIALAIWPWLAAIALVWLVSMSVALRRSRATWRAALPTAVFVGIGVAILIFAITPPWNQSSLDEMKYWVDWANLLGIAAAWGVAGFALAWPALVAFCPRCQRVEVGSAAAVS